jgi:uncharacterized protein (DUF2141 family)
MKIFYNGLYSFALLMLLIFSAAGFSGCANIVPPVGGPRDTIPPRLVSAQPVDSARHFTEKKIVLNFNEYIDGKDIRTELLVSPVPKVDPLVDIKLRVVTIRLKDTLQPHTTYMIDFGRGIKDVNEGNILRNFTYVFSTGDSIDRGDLTGNILVANTGGADSTIIAMLHVNDSDSAVIKDRPRYIARSDSSGRFHFRFVKPGRYRLYALKDEGGSHKYLSKAQLFGFADSPIVIGNATPPVTLYAYEAGVETKPPSSGGAVSNANPPKRPKKNNDTRLQVQTNLIGGVLDVLDTFRLIFSSGLKVFDSTQIRFTDDNYHDLPLNQYHYARDSTNRDLTLFYPWPTDSKFHLILPRTFGSDSLGRKLLKDDTISIATKKNIDYGEVQIRVGNLDLSRHPVLQFVQSDKIKYAYSFNTRRIVRKILFPPGEYELRILYDTNGNGVWDPGVFFGKTKRQPEKVVTIRKKMNVKANWDNDWDTTL